MSMATTIPSTRYSLDREAIFPTSVGDPSSHQVRLLLRCAVLHLNESSLTYVFRVSQDVVLTAASCFDNGRTVRFVDVGATTNFLPENFIAVESILLHPRYDKNNPTRDYDFALLKLEEKSVKKPARILLDTDFPGVGGFPLETIGFGFDPLFFPWDSLKSVLLEYVPFAECRDEFFPDISSNLHECATGLFAFEGPCPSKFSSMWFSLI